MRYVASLSLAVCLTQFDVDDNDDDAWCGRIDPQEASTLECGRYVGERSHESVRGHLESWCVDDVAVLRVRVARCHGQPCRALQVQPLVRSLDTSRRVTKGLFAMQSANSDHSCD